MTRILTLTMNPALDLSTSVDRVEAVHKLRCDAARLHPGGGGINVARVVHRLGAPCLAAFPAGGVTGLRLRQLLDDEGVPSHVLAIQGETRESFSVHERSSGQDFRFVLPGPALSEPEWQAALALAEAWSAGHAVPRPSGADLLVVSGSLPPGVPTDFYARLAALARAHRVRLVLDTSGPALAQALAAGVYLFKPSLRELRELTGQALNTDAQCLAAARQLIDAGQAEVVALSLGEQGSMLVTAGQAWRAPALSVQVASTIGAGDSFVAGMVWALSQGRALPDALRHGMAASAAALLSAGTALCQPADVARLHDAVNLIPLDA